MTYINKTMIDNPSLTFRAYETKTGGESNYTYSCNGTVILPDQLTSLREVIRDLNKEDSFVKQIENKNIILSNSIQVLKNTSPYTEVIGDVSEGIDLANIIGDIPNGFDSKPLIAVEVSPENAIYYTRSDGSKVKIGQLNERLVSRETLPNPLRVAFNPWRDKLVLVKEADNPQLGVVAFNKGKISLIHPDYSISETKEGNTTTYQLRCNKPSVTTIYHYKTIAAIASATIAIIGYCAAKYMSS